MAPIIGYANWTEAVDTLTMVQGSASDLSNIQTQRTEEPATITMADGGGGAGVAEIYLGWNDTVVANSFAIHHWSGIPTDTTITVTRYNSLTQIPGNVIDSRSLPAVHTYTAETSLDDKQSKPHTIISFTEILNGNLQIVAASVRSVSIKFESPTGNGDTFTIGMLGALTTVSLIDAVYQGGVANSYKVNLREGAVSPTLNGGVTSTSRLATEDPMFSFDKMGAKEKNTYEHVLKTVGTSWPVYVEFRPDLTEFRDRESQGGFIRFIGVPRISPIGAHDNTASDAFAITQQMFTVWR